MSSLNMLEFLRKEQLNQLLGSQERIQLAKIALGRSENCHREIRRFQAALLWQTDYGHCPATMLTSIHVGR
ncbi:MAG: hypothetical protein VCD66_13805, partial [Alphaproteobacteria bacterium]